MSFAVFQQLTHSTVIDSCTFCSFTSNEAANLVLTKGDRLEVYEVKKKQGKLVFLFAVPLFGRPEAVSAFRPQEGGPDSLALVLKRARYLAVLRYDPSLGAARTCGQHVLIAPDEPISACLPTGFRPQLAVDPDQRCLAVRTLPDRVMVFPVSSDASWKLDAGPAVSQQGGLAFHQDPEHPPGLRAPFSINAWSPLRLHHLEDIAFLHGYHQPTAVILGQAKPGWGGCLSESNKGNSSILVVVLDLTEKAPHLIWAAHRLPHDVFRVLPLMAPVGGMLALSNNAVVYIKEHGPSFCQTLNAAAGEGDEFTVEGLPLKDESKLGILLSGCAAVALSPTVLLFSVQPAGRLYLAHLVLSSRETVRDIIWTSPGLAAPAWELCAVGEEFAFLAAASGSSTLLRVQQSKKKLPANLQPSKRVRVSEPEKAEDGKEKAPAPSQRFKELLEIHEELRDVARYLRSYNLTAADELPATGPLQCLAPWCKDRSEEANAEEAEENQESSAADGTERFVFGCGSGSRGSLYFFQRAVPLESLTEFDLPAGTPFSAVWSLRRPAAEPVVAEAPEEPAALAGKRKRDAEEGEPEEINAADTGKDVLATAAAAASAAASADGEVAQHGFVLVSGGSKTMMLEATEEIEEISKAIPLDIDSATVCAGSVLRNRLVVQVSSRQLRFMLAASPRAAAPQAPVDFVAAAEACGGSVCDPYTAVRFGDQSLRLFAAASEASTEELTGSLPEAVTRGVLCASLYRDRALAATFLAVVTTASRGTLRVVNLADMKEVFQAEHLVDVPAVLRTSGASGVGCELDHLRAFSDVCAPLPKGAFDAQAMKLQDTKADDAASSVICAELIEVDQEDCGPTLVLLIVGRPILVYRAFSPQPPPEPAGKGDPAAAFPYHFALSEHDFLGLIESAPVGPQRSVVALPNATGASSGAVVVPPHTGIPALWLAARRNQLFVHPLPGVHFRGFAPLHAPCCDSGFFALAQPQGAASVTAQVHQPALVEGLPEGQAGFDLCGSLPTARKVLQRTPHCMATQPADGVIALAVSEAVVESPEPAGPSVDEDPLGEDWSIVRVPPVEAEPPPLPRMQQSFELWLDDVKGLGKLGRYRFSFDTDEHVLCLSWVTIPGFPTPSVAVGTGVNTGEDLTSRGRVLIFSTKDREPGVIPPVYQRSLKCPVTVIGQHGGYFIHSEGYKIFFERWENSSFNKVAFFDGSMCVTSMSSIKNFLLFGDLRKGIDFVQWKEETASQTRNLRRLSRSPPSTSMTVLACEFVVCHKSLGLIALDHTGSAHLFSYSPHSDGREGDQLLRSCATFSMGFPCRSALRLQAEPGVQSLLMASGGGELLCLRPIDDQAYRTVATLLGLLATRLPFRGGLNPRAFRHHDGSHALVAPRKNIEDAVLLRVFAFLSAPLQRLIAEKMRLSVASIMKATIPCATCQLFSLRQAEATASK